MSAMSLFLAWRDCAGAGIAGDGAIPQGTIGATKVRASGRMRDGTWDCYARRFYRDAKWFGWRAYPAFLRALVSGAARVVVADGKRTLQTLRINR